MNIRQDALGELKLDYTKQEKLPFEEEAASEE